MKSSGRKGSAKKISAGQKVDAKVGLTEKELEKRGPLVLPAFRR